MIDDCVDFCIGSLTFEGAIAPALHEEKTAKQRC